MCIWKRSKKPTSSGTTVLTVPTIALSEFKGHSEDPSPTPIAQLPDDLIGLILDLLSSKNDLRACSLINRTWLPHVQSRLFTNFECTLHPYDFVACPTPVTCSRKTRELEGIVKRSPHIAHYFRTLQIRFNPNTSGPNASLGTFCAWDSVLFLIPRMIGVRDIQLINVHPKVLKWSSLPQRLRETFLECISRPSLCFFRIERVHQFPIDSVFESQSLISLELHNAGFSPPMSRYQALGSSPEAEGARAESSVNQPIFSSLEKLSFRGSEDGKAATQLLNCLGDSGSSAHGQAFGQLEQLSFVLHRSEDLLLISILRQSAFSLKDLTLTVDPGSIAITSEVCTIMQNLISLEILRITFNNIPDNADRFRRDMTKTLYFLSKADCPLNEIHITLQPLPSRHLNIRTEPWEDVDNAMSYWINKGTLQRVHIGFGPPQRTYLSPRPMIFFPKCLERVAASGILNPLFP
ncbi:hypothetical protein BDN72DRAFT_899085 [Pluteus cervinus]|uniref:Uncharacterized protein n=1 Tax=Pluteus cervinus TaxID=181527 RepID=A0ACD3AP22_9AGAR|nr:hypothetical protein BDN72DRAFT_899085 [Pluteus cervinus]